MSFKFSKKLRLLTTMDFNFVFENSKKTNILYMTLFSRINMLNHPRIGVSISKKFIKHSNKRNYIKRLVREYFRLHQYILPKMDFVFVITSSVMYFNSDNIKKILEKLWSIHYHLVQNV